MEQAKAIEYLNLLKRYKWVMGLVPICLLFLNCYLC